LPASGAVCACGMRVRFPSHRACERIVKDMQDVNQLHEKRVDHGCTVKERNASQRHTYPPAIPRMPCCRRPSASSYPPTRNSQLVSAAAATCASRDGLDGNGHRGGGRQDGGSDGRGTSGARHFTATRGRAPTRRQCATAPLESPRELTSACRSTTEYDPRLMQHTPAGRRRQCSQ